MTLSKRAYWTVIASLLAAVVILTVYLSLSATPGRPALALDRYSCTVQSTGTITGHNVLRVLNVTNIRAHELADTLCRSETVATDYSAVEVTWQPRGLLETEELSAQKYALIWNRQRVLDGLLSEVDNYYSVLFSTPTYSVYWLSQDDKPALTTQYFAGKQVGLINDTQSQSSYQLPMSQLHTAGITLGKDQLHFFDDRRTLYQAFLHRQVDVISGIAHIGGVEIPENHRLLIAGDIPTGHWFISDQARKQGLTCDLAAALGVLMPVYQSLDPAFEPSVPGCQP